MNRWEEEQFKKDLWNSVFFSSGTKKEPICWERLRKRRKKEYEQLAVQLKKLHKIKSIEEEKKEEERKQKEKKLTYTKPNYTEEDKEFLRQALINEEISMLDLTADEVFLLKLSYPEYLHIQRMIYANMKLTKKGWKEYYKNRNLLGQEITPRIALKLYQDANNKYPPKKK